MGVKRAISNASDRFVASLSEDGHYKLLVDAITDYAIYMLDPDGIILSWNAGAQRFKGYEADEVVGEHYSLFFIEEDRARNLPMINLQRAEEEGRLEAEGWRIRKDGSRFWAHVVIDPITDPSGGLVGYAKITRDLTERKLAEEALRRSEAQFRLLVQGVTDYAIYMLDPEGTIISWNSGAQKIKGYEPHEIIGQNFSRFYSEEDQKRGEPAQNLAAATRLGRVEREGWRIRKDGSRFFANIIIDTIRDEGGELVGFAKITRDITERAEAQRELERTREALFQAQKMEAIGQLTGGVAHDFNNLLTVISASLELLAKRIPPDARTRPLLENALQAADRGASLTQRMLAFARRQDLKPSAVDVPELVRGMASLLQRTLGPAIRIDTRFPLSMPPAFTDPNQLEAALLNLAVNARDAMPRGGQLTIEASEMYAGEGQDQLAPGRYLKLAVTDQGEGMDDETLKRATEPFFTTKGVGKGTGLGLPMVQGLMAQSGGKLELKSRVGHGTSVELWLPAAQQEEVHEVQPVPDGSAGMEHGSSGLTIMAVDDDALVLMNTAAMLEDLGYRVIEAASGQSALSLLRGGVKVDLVITDFAMPGMNGLQLAAAIHELAPELPVVLASGYAELPGGEKTDLKRIPKPFFQRDLLRVIEETVGRDH